VKVPTGLQPLVACRLRGKLPSRRVTILVGDEWRAPDWQRWVETMPYPEAVIRSTDNIDRLDFRCLVGLAVFVHAVRFDARVARVLELVQQVANYTLLSVEECGGSPEFIEWRRAA